MFIQLVDTLRTRFVERGFTEIEIAEGVNSRIQQANFGTGSANRIAFVPISPLEITPPKFIGEDSDEHRQLLNVMFSYDVAFAGYDVDNPERDLAHRRRCFDMFEVTVQEVQRAYWGAHTWTSARWEDSRKDGRHGAELIVTLVLNVPIFDVTYVSATPAGIPAQPKPVEG